MVQSKIETLGSTRIRGTGANKDDAISNAALEEVVQMELVTATDPPKLTPRGATCTQAALNNHAGPVDRAAPSPPAVRVLPGYRPGFLARCLDMHMAYYHAITGWGLAFETALARDFGDILARLASSPTSQVWSALGPDDGILGTVLLDASGADVVGAAPRRRSAQLRGFIIDPAARGLGVGRKMLDAVMAHVRAAGVEEVMLHTMGSLEAAVHLYRGAGFVVESVYEQVVWEVSLPQMRLIWRADGAGAAAVQAAELGPL
ncbi:transcriptional regulator [Verticillium alfalfae VaMs.102]|uniref:Transcriptional regulator n=1 Tax=Verticillium alfalfae (strain VaMs.102 / ATCC MYA-4576 / FGSC 10136) TaxID=526221 RepID=C9SJI4_VERA1|nr:transcriptional regulator [Verticillium alfalfae VaMs.102]EEY18346.1 transcriptional regulator [Verticillium alfalfae VaMs.102]